MRKTTRETNSETSQSMTAKVVGVERSENRRDRDHSLISCSSRYSARGVMDSLGRQKCLVMIRNCPAMTLVRWHLC